MSEQNAPRTPYVPKDPTRDWNLRIRGVTLEGADRPTSLSFEIYNGRPRIVYRTGMQGTPQETIVTAAFSLHGFNAHLVLLEKVIKGELDGFMTDTKGNPILPDGQRSKEIKTLVRLKVERNTDGVITYGVTAGPNFATGNFELLPDEYHHFCKPDRSPLEPKLVSEIVAQGIIETWRPVMAIMACAVGTPAVDAATTTAAAPANDGGYQKKPWQGNNQGGNFQKKPWQGGNNNNQGGNNQGGGYQKKPWQGGNNQGGGYQKKPWQGNNNNQGGNFQKKPWQGNNNQGGGWKDRNQGGGGNQGGGQEAKSYSSDNFDNDIPF